MIFEFYNDFSIFIININAPSDLPMLLRSILALFELSFQLFDSLDNRVIVFACPMLVRFHVLYREIECVAAIDNYRKE